MQEQEQAEAPERDFTFSYPREKISWKAIPHFLGPKEQSPSSKEPVSPSISTRQPFTNRSFGDQRTSSNSSSQQTDSPSPAMKTSDPAQPEDERPLTLFQFTYDTYTRDHLEALVEEIDSLHTIPSRNQKRLEPSAQEAEPRWEGISDAQDSEEERPIYRSSKRIRLSPRDERTQRPADRLKIPATPRSAVRDRIRERRRATDVPQSHVEATPSRTGLSLPTAASNPTLLSPPKNPIPIFLQPETPRPASANPVANRLSQAQALIDRIRQQPPRGSVSSFEASSSAASASINRPFSSDSSGFSHATPEANQHLDQSQSSYQPQMAPSRFVVGPAGDRSGIQASTTSGSGTIKVGGSTISSRRTISTQLTSSYGFSKVPEVQKVPEATSIASRSQMSTGSQYLQPLKSGFDTTTATHSQSSQISSRSAQSRNGMTTIAPQDIPHLLQPTQGKMIYDAAMSKWVKSSTRSNDVPEEMELERSSDDDVFKDIESFASKGNLSFAMEQVVEEDEEEEIFHEREQQEEQEELDHREGEDEQYEDVEEPEDDEQGDWQAEQQDMDGTEQYLEEGDEDPELEDQAPLELFEAVNQLSQSSLTIPPDSPLEAQISFVVNPPTAKRAQDSPYISTFNSKAQGQSLSDPLATPAISRPAIRPRSVLKSRSDPMISTPLQREGSPVDSFKGRSVSFSDGRVAGKIQAPRIRSISPQDIAERERRGSALKYEVQTEGETQEESPDREASPNNSIVSTSASLRTKKITRALTELNEIGKLFLLFIRLH